VSEARHGFSRSSGRGMVTIGASSAEVRTLLACKDAMKAGSVADVVRAALRAYFERSYPELLSGDGFALRKRKQHYSWPTLHDDVKSWVDGMPIDRFMKPGLSQNALKVRFYQYAQDQGWIQERVLFARRSKAIEELTNWLATDRPTPSNRRIAECIVAAGSPIAGARNAGVSRQRASQVIKAAKVQMMAERVGGFPRKVDRIDPRPWSDGSVWKLRKGVDFTVESDLAAQKIRAFGANHGFKVSIQRDLTDRDVIYVQMVAKLDIKQAS
jgi:hypothetical protein